MAAAGKTVAILGGGWGGLVAAHLLRDLLDDEHRLIVVERSETFALRVSNLWLMTGERPNPDHVRRPMAALKRKGIEWLHADVLGIDPGSCTVSTSAGDLNPDHLIIALGADSDLDPVPGLATSAYDLYDANAAANLKLALDEFRGGRVVLLVAGVPFRCPAAPYEAAMLVEATTRQRGLREQVSISLYTPEKQPMPVAGSAIGSAVAGMLAAKGIDFHPGRTVSQVDADARVVRFDEGEVPFDLLIAVPPHRAPRVVVDAGLTDSTGYIPVHPQTLEILTVADELTTGYPGVHGIGDVTAVRLMNGMLLPKAGIFAEGEARVVARSIAAAIAGTTPTERFDGRGGCYLEAGDRLAGYADGNFYAHPAPTVTMQPPTAEHRRAKEEFERVLDNWFEPAVMPGAD